MEENLFSLTKDKIKFNYIIQNKNNKNPKIKFAKIRKVKSPLRESLTSAGIDFFIPDEYPETLIKPNESILIPSGIKVNVPKGYVLIAFNKSEISTKKNLYVNACVIDENYQEEIYIHLTNVGFSNTIVSPGEKIIQFILIPVFYSNIIEVSLENLHTSVSEHENSEIGSTDIN